MEFFFNCWRDLDKITPQNTADFTARHEYFEPNIAENEEEDAPDRKDKNQKKKKKKKLKDEEYYLEKARKAAARSLREHEEQRGVVDASLLGGQFGEGGDSNRGNSFGRIVGKGEWN